jgi:hypothetical protein
VILSFWHPRTVIGAVVDEAILIDLLRADWLPTDLVR